MLLLSQVIDTIMYISTSSFLAMLEMVENGEGGQNMSTMFSDLREQSYYKAG